MNHTFLIFFGAGLGGVLRYWISNGVHIVLGKTFPFGTLIVNISGCFLMGVLFVLTLARFNHLNTELRALLLIGLLGGYTTFSSFSIETIHLLESGNWQSAFMNILLSVMLGLAAAWLGIIVAKSIAIYS